MIAVSDSIAKRGSAQNMDSNQDLDRAARETVTQLLEALQASDVEKYRSLMCDSDQEILTQEEVDLGLAAMREQNGRLLSFQIEGIVLHAEAAHAAAHVTLQFENAAPKTELYNLTFEDSGWRLDFDFAELRGSGI